MNRNIGIDNRYLQTKIQTASPMELIIILYDGAINSVGRALENYNNRKRKEYDESIFKAKRFIKELQMSLNLDIKPIALQLYSLYDYMIRELGDAICNRKGSKQRLLRVMKMLRELRETWNKVKDKVVVEKDKNSLENLSLSI